MSAEKQIPKRDSLGLEDGDKYENFISSFSLFFFLVLRLRVVVPSIVQWYIKIISRVAKNTLFLILLKLLNFSNENLLELILVLKS